LLLPSSLIHIRPSKLTRKRIRGDLSFRATGAISGFTINPTTTSFLAINGSLSLTTIGAAISSIVLTGLQVLSLAGNMLVLFFLLPDDSLLVATSSSRHRVAPFLG
jgi:hypothetical protein